MSCWYSSYLAALERSLNAYVYVVVNSFSAFLCPLFRMLFGHLPCRWVCCCSRMSYWFSSYLAALERSLNAYVYVVVNSLPPFYVHCSDCYSVISWSLGCVVPQRKVVDLCCWYCCQFSLAFLCPLSRMLFGHLPCRWGVLFPSEKLLVYVVYVVVNSFPATRLSRYHSPKLPRSYRVVTE